MSVVKSRHRWKTSVGGEKHRGWLPAGAAMPLPTPAREVRLNVHIEHGAGGFLLVYFSEDGTLCGDTWHATIGEAEAAALDQFGLAPSDWERPMDGAG